MAQRLVLRFGTTAAMSAGALTVLLLTAGPAQASNDCPPGTDPETTFKNWQCQWDNLTKPKPSPTPTKSATKPTAAPSKRTTSPAKHTTTKPAPNHRRPVAAPSGSGGTGDRTPVTAFSQAVRATPYTAGSGGDLTGLLPQPDVAGAPLPAGTGADSTLHTRLVAPMAATEPRQDGQMLWVAAAAGLAGAVGALNISVAGRRLSGRRAPR